MRHEKLLSAEECLLLVVDVQEAFSAHIMEFERVVERSGIMVEAAKLLGVPILVTEQYPKGLGATVEPLRGLLEGVGCYAKTAFSCCGDPAIAKAIEETGRRQVLMVGIETHVCISQTAHDLQAMGLEAYLAVDAISARRQIDHETALERLGRSVATITTTEAAIFEMARSSGHEQFRALSKLVK